MAGPFRTNSELGRVASDSVYLLDTNAIIEAVRTGVWAAICGGLLVETVAECADECRRGDQIGSDYVVVNQTDLDRLRAIHVPTDDQIAAVLANPKSAALDDGERDLMAHALSRAEPPQWLVCSPDLASIKFAVDIGLGDRLTSLEETVRKVGGRTASPLRRHFSANWLSGRRTEAILGAILLT